MTRASRIVEPGCPDLTAKRVVTIDGSAVSVFGRRVVLGSGESDIIEFSVVSDALAFAAAVGAPKKLRFDAQDVATQQYASRSAQLLDQGDDSVNVVLTTGLSTAARPSLRNLRRRSRHVPAHASRPRAAVERLPTVLKRPRNRHFCPVSRVSFCPACDDRLRSRSPWGPVMTTTVSRNSGLSRDEILSREYAEPRPMF